MQENFPSSLNSHIERVPPSMKSLNQEIKIAGGLQASTLFGIKKLTQKLHEGMEKKNSCL